MIKVFSILKFIKESNINGNILSNDNFPLDKLGLDEEELNFYLKNIYEGHLISGIECVNLPENKVKIKIINPTITSEGMDYLDGYSKIQ